MDKFTFVSNILKYWYLIEFLNQLNFPVEEKSNQQTNKDIAAGKKIRKQINVYHMFSSEEIKLESVFEEDLMKYPLHNEISDEISICLGKIKRLDCVEYFRKKFKLEDDSAEQNHSQISLVGLKCDGHGCYTEKSFNISPLIWAIKRLQNHGGEINNETLSNLLSLKDYSDDVIKIEDMLTFRNDKGECAGKSLTSELFRQIYSYIQNTYIKPIFGDDSSASPQGIIIYKRYQSEEDKAKDNDALYYSDLNKSFFTNDLQMIIDRVSDKSYGTSNSMEKAVIDYVAGAYAEEHHETGWIDFSERLDIRGINSEEERDNFFNRYLDVNLAPMGKWPSKYMPAFMQQLAVNFGMHKESDCNDIFSVNGPPGTGKTTLLKEIIAGNLVERAKLLSEYNDPDDAFKEKHFEDGHKSKQGYSNYHSVYYDFINDKIKNYGMLVASCNNAAVENISKELPSGPALCNGLSTSEKDAMVVCESLDEVKKLFSIKDVIDTESYCTWVDGAKQFKHYPEIYFTKYANDTEYKKEGEWDRWGLISAPFGKSGNLSNYAQRVLMPYINDFGSNAKIESRKKQYLESVKIFRKQFDKVESLQQKIHAISSSRKSFMEKRAEIEQQCRQLLSEILKKQNHIKSLKQKALDLENRANQILLKQQNINELIHTIKAKNIHQNQYVQQDEQNVQLLREEIIKLESGRGLKDIIFAFLKKATLLSITIDEKRREFEQKEQELKVQKENRRILTLQIEEQQHRINALEMQMKQLKSEQKICIENQNSDVISIEKMEDSIAIFKKRTEQEYAKYIDVLNIAGETEDVLKKMTVLDEVFWKLYDSENEKEITKAQVLNPWFTEEYNREREKLFYVALQLHKNFLLSSKSCLFNIKNLLLMWRLLENDDKELVKISVRDRQNCLGALLNTVFLLTPVLSTTFASVGNMLSDIKHPGEIGLLIIDEAGQAQPHMALGAFYRCRRAIVVGDPKQVEPVVTDEMDAIKKIIRNNINALYQSKYHSVQEFADRINPIGTYLKGISDSEKTWVGCPLVVHRRCISPMYEISNMISYNNTMKQQTVKPTPEKETGFCLESSRWINVRGTENNSSAKDHFVKTQGERAIELIKLAFSKTTELPSLYVISPFTTVKDGLIKAVKNLPEYKSDDRISEWIQTHIGTVHTFQGKEADEVIFLLGCDKNAIPAAKWVNTNIVNVAVTRAKYRVYVIGDYAVWQHSPVMQKVKCIMDSYAIRVLDEITKKPQSENDKHCVEFMLKQTPSIESFQTDGEIDELMVDTFQNSLSDIWTEPNNLSDEGLSLLNLSFVDLQNLDLNVKKKLICSIKLYSLFTLIKERYSLEHMDFTCSGIMFCKTMELHLKNCMLSGFQILFSSLSIRGKSLATLKEKDAMIGTFTYVLQDDNRREQLVQKQVEFNNKSCDKEWWNKYYQDLDEFRELRNLCCHPEDFEWQHVIKLMEILFERQTFLKTFAGKKL